MIIAKYLPNYIYQFGLGSGRSSSISFNIIFLLISMFATLSPKGAILFFSYFLLSDVLFLSSWVDYE